MQPKAIVVFGDCRDIHVVARNVAAERGIPFFSFEEGYVRPSYVTFERGGNNAHSPLTRYVAEMKEGNEDAGPPVGPTFGRMAFSAAWYLILLRMGKAAFPHFRNHRQRRLLPEIVFWMRSYLRRLSGSRREAALIRHLRENHWKSYFVVALQVYDDLQLRHHADGWTTRSLIETSIVSFSQHAAAFAHLCIKQHPLDRGHVSYRDEVTAMTGRLGIGGRVHYLAGGDVPNLLEGAAGLVTINSTIAVGALLHHCPVFACGDAFYRVPGLIAEGRDKSAMAKFFAGPPAANEDIAGRLSSERHRQFSDSRQLLCQENLAGARDRRAECLEQSGGPFSTTGSEFPFASLR